MNKKIDTKEYETMTQHDLIEILNHWEQLAFQKTNEVKRLREALQIVKQDLDSAIAQGHIPIRATHGIDVEKIRNFAHDASL
jgi:hypothetical protein|tara:strand:- start:231 stop:476 length:246 start_codon:yes stop_codon:yes gene_type:complete